MSNSIRTLFISKDPPYPPFSGTCMRIWQNVNIMTEFGSVAFFTACRWKPTQKSLPKIALWQHYDVATPLSPLENLKHKFWWLRSQGHPNTDWAYAQMGAGKLDKLLTEFKPDLVIVEELWLYRYLKTIQRHQCSIILVEHNIEYPLCQTHSNSNSNLITRLKTNLKLSRLKKIEDNFIDRVDQVWVCSNYDASLVQQLYKSKTPLYVIPNGVNISNYQDVYSGHCDLPEGLESKQQNILFLGQMSYPPNSEAVDILLNSIYPRLREIYPHLRLLLVGAQPTSWMLEAAQKDPQILVTGKVKDVRPYLAAASLMIVPLKKGGGTRLKILEAFAAGCPVVSTSKGAEGLNAQDGEHLLIRDSIEEIISGVNELLLTPSLGEKLAHSAYEFVKSNYSWEAITQQIKVALEDLKLIP